ncbi:MAG: hypothetical protein JSV58_01520, partial [Candidatus Bathyarchaeota archaeon]
GITHNTMDGFFANEPPIMIGTDMPMYSAGMNMTVSLNINNPLSSPINVCVAVWLERPTGPIIVILHAHAVTLPGKFRYSNPSFSQFTLPPIPPGIYKWHAALMSPGSHAILIQDIAEWEFV